jgi:amino acid transporter
VAMARQVANAGAFYAYVARGLGQPCGVAAAWIALLAYNSLQVGLYGLVGVAAAPLLNGWLGIEIAWWVIALVAWALVAVLGVQQVDVNGRILAVLMLAEIGILLVFAASSLTHPEAGTIATDALSVDALLGPGMGALLALGVLGFVGFESAVVFSEESRDPRRTVPVATFVSIAIIGVLYALSAWALTVAVGPAQVVTAAQQQGADLLFGVADAQLGPGWADLGRALLVTSVLAAMISFHNTAARYLFALGREHVLPPVLGRTATRTGSPIIGSLLQSVVGLAVIVVYAAVGADPLTRLFFLGGATGALGVLILLAVTAVAILVHFARQPASPGYPSAGGRPILAPAVAVVAVGAVLYLAVDHLDTLLGVAQDSPLTWAVPAGYATAAVLGLGWAVVLRVRRPDIYARIGYGAKAAALTTSSAMVAGQVQR